MTKPTTIDAAAVRALVQQPPQCECCEEPATRTVDGGLGPYNLCDDCTFEKLSQTRCTPLSELTGPYPIGYEDQLAAVQTALAGQPAGTTKAADKCPECGGREHGLAHVDQYCAHEWHDAQPAEPGMPKDDEPAPDSFDGPPIPIAEVESLDAPAPAVSRGDDRQAGAPLTGAQLAAKHGFRPHGRDPLTGGVLRHVDGTPVEPGVPMVLAAEKDAAYHERDLCVLAIVRLAQAQGCTAGLGRHVGEVWDDDWRNVVYVDLPAGQVSWHIHDSELPLFQWLPAYAGSWDGHTTDEKYARATAVPAPTVPVSASGESVHTVVQDIVAPPGRFPQDEAERIYRRFRAHFAGAAPAPTVPASMQHKEPPFPYQEPAAVTSDSVVYTEPKTGEALPADGCAGDPASFRWLMGRSIL